MTGLPFSLSCAPADFFLWVFQTSCTQKVGANALSGNLQVTFCSFVSKIEFKIGQSQAYNTGFTKTRPVVVKIGQNTNKCSKCVVS